MEDVLETYKKPFDKRFPVLCMDEQPAQLLKETRVPIPASKEHARRVDYEYERNGTASIFMFADPLKGCLLYTCDAADDMQCVCPRGRYTHIKYRRLLKC